MGNIIVLRLNCEQIFINITQMNHFKKSKKKNYNLSYDRSFLMHMYFKILESNIILKNKTLKCFILVYKFLLSKNNSRMFPFLKITSFFIINRIVEISGVI